MFYYFGQESNFAPCVFAKATIKFEKGDPNNCKIELHPHQKIYLLYIL